MSLYKVAVGDTPRISDINQVVDALSGALDVGIVTVAGAISAPAGAGSATNATGAELGIGTYTYGMTYITGVQRSDGTLYVTGETPVGPTWTVVTTSGYQRVALTNLPNGASTVIGKRIYRGVVGSATLKLVATLAATAPSYTDTTADASLGVAPPTTNSTGSYLAVSSVSAMPASGTAGRLVRLTTDNKLYIDTGTAWVALAQGGDLSAHTSRTDNPHSVTAAQAGAVAKAGDTMTGLLIETQAAPAAGAVQAYWTLQQAGANNFQFALDSSGNLLMQRYSAGAWTTVATFPLAGGVVTGLNADMVDGYRFRVNGTTGALEYSSDGNTWNTAGMTAAQIRRIARLY